MATGESKEAHRYLFGNFEFSTAPRVLRLKGRELAVRSQVLRLLDLLLSNAGEIVTRSDIVRVIWGSEDKVEADASINALLHEMRKALDDDVKRPEFVETVHGRGYRFVAPVTVRSTPLVSQAAATKRPVRWLSSLLSVVSVLTLLAVGWWLWGSRSQRQPNAPPTLAVQIVREVSTRSQGETLVRAVERGMANRLIERTWGSLTIVPSSSEAPHRDSDYLLVAEVDRWNGATVDLTLQLILVHDGRLMWIDSYSINAEQQASVVAEVVEDVIRAVSRHSGYPLVGRSAEGAAQH